MFESERSQIAANQAAINIARSQLEEEKVKILENEKQVGVERGKITSIRSGVLYPEKRIPQLQRKERMQQEELLTKTLPGAETELSLYESGVLAPAREGVKSYASEIEAKQAELDTANKYLSDWESGYNAGVDEHFVVLNYENAAFREGWKSGNAQAEVSQQISTFNKAMKDLGLKPIYTKGNITAFQDLKLGMSYSSDKLGTMRPTDIPKLEGIGFEFITTKTTPTSYSENFYNPDRSKGEYTITDITPNLLGSVRPTTTTTIPTLSTQATKSFGYMPAGGGTMLFGIGGALGLPGFGFHLDNTKTVIKDAGNIIDQKLTGGQISSTLSGGVKIPIFTVPYPGYGGYYGIDANKLQQDIVKKTLIPRQDEIKLADSKIKDYYENKTSTALYDLYGKDIESRSVSFENAKTLFENTPQYNNIVTEYNKALNDELNKMGKNGVTKGRLYELLGEVINIVPTTWGGVLSTAAVVGLGSSLGFSKYALTSYVVRKPVISTFDIGSNLLLGNPSTQTRKFFKSAASFTAVSYVNPINKLLIGSYGSELLTSLVKNPEETIIKTGEYIYKEPGEFLGMVVGSTVGQVAVESAAAKLKLGTIAEKTKLLSFDKRLVRQTVDLIIHAPEYGMKVIMGVDKDTGNIIRIGGEIKRGQTIFEAMLEELKQETGLKIGDIIKYNLVDQFKSAGSYKNVIEVWLKKGAVDRIKPRSDITGITFENIPSSYTGGTPFFPATTAPKYLLFGKKMRSEDAYMLSRLKYTKDFEYFYEKLSQIQIKNLLEIAKKELISKFGKDSLKNYTTKQILKDYYLYKNNMLYQPVVLPTSLAPFLTGAGSRYNISFKEQLLFTDINPILRKLKNVYKKELIPVKELEPADFLMSGKLSQPKIKVTKNVGKKSYREGQLLSHGSPADTLTNWLTGVGEVKGSTTKRGSKILHTSPPTYPGSKMGYIALNYLFGSEKGTIVYGFLSRTPTAYISKTPISAEAAKIGEKVRKAGGTKAQIEKAMLEVYKKKPGTQQLTYKSVLSGELESGFTDRTILKVIKTERIFISGRYIMVKTVKVVNAPRIKALNVLRDINIIRRGANSLEVKEAINRVKKETGIDYSESGVRYRKLPTPGIYLGIEREKNIGISERLFNERKSTTERKLVIKEQKIKEKPKIPERPGISERLFNINKLRESPKPPEYEFRLTRTPIVKKSYYNSELLGTRISKARKPIQKGREYLKKPTETQLTFGLVSRKVPLSKLTGFELAR